jgi:enoyl-[acyl-carrier protein] reductase III
MPPDAHGFLSGQVVLVTGGSRGIGRAISLRLARENPAHLVIAYCMNAEAARRTLLDVRALGVQASVTVCDVGNEQLQCQMFARIDEEFGRLDVFVANAARTTFRSAKAMDLRSWRRTQELNTEAFLVGTQLAAAIMRRNSGGRIIGLSSLGSRYYTPNYAALGAAKAAIENLARYLAVELAPDKINVNVVCGGFVDTESMRMIPDYDILIKTVAARTPAGRLGQPEDLAGIAAFLCSPESEWIRGQTIIADGGFSLSV